MAKDEDYYVFMYFLPIVQYSAACINILSVTSFYPIWSHAWSEVISLCNKNFETANTLIIEFKENSRKG